MVRDIAVNSGSRNKEDIAKRMATSVGIKQCPQCALEVNVQAIRDNA